MELEHKPGRRREIQAAISHRLGMDLSPLNSSVLFLLPFLCRCCTRTRGRPGSINLCRVQSCRPSLVSSVPVEIPVWEEAAGLRRAKMGIWGGSACFPTRPQFAGAGSVPSGGARRLGSARRDALQSL